MLELRKGTQLADRYTLVRKLGGGGEAQLWLAKDRLTAASVALKIVPGEPHNTERLRSEWQTGIRLMHAHIARAFEFHAGTEVAFYSQQFIDGPDIGVMAGLPPGEILAPIGLIADALRYLHARDLVHRDIKASNILLDHNGAPYLTDFGVTAATGAIAGGGSPIARSPQSLSGMPAQPADDIFALGGLIYELLAGKPPWSPLDIAADIQHKAPAPLRAADGSALPAAIVDLLALMLDKDAGNRPDAQTVAECLSATGFAAGVATVRAGTRTALDDEVVEAVESIRPVSRAATTGPAVVSRDTSGISQKTVVIGLGVLLAALFTVVFVLPGGMQENASPGDRQISGPAAGAEGASDGDGPMVDPEVRRRLQQGANIPNRALRGEDISFSENNADYSGLDAEGRARYKAELTLGELLSALEVLEGRGVERWAAMEYRKAKDIYDDGDAAYLDREFAAAEEFYLGAITVLEPLYERIEPTFLQAYTGARRAFDEGDRLEALRLYELAVAITPTHGDALAGLQRAKNLEAVLRLVDRGLEYEEDLELEAAQESFERALELDGLWEPAHEGVLRVIQARTELEFNQRMTDGFEAIAAGDFLAARAAFRVAQRLIPESNEPADGLLQIDQGLRLQQIGLLEQEALALEQDEHWDAVVKTYEEILKIDGTLSFASEGLIRGREMGALHSQLDDYIAEPDRLSNSTTMQRATLLVVDITTRAQVGPRLAAQRDELSRLLKRAATPLTVPLVSDNLTQVSIYRVGRLGSFETTEVSLRPGTYVAVGVRPGYRDVRQEFRVAPEIDIEAVVVRCEEQI